MLDQHADETLHRTEWRAVDDHWPVRRVIRTDVTQVEPLRQLIIHLHGPELPLPADHVLDDEVDLRTVERGLAGLDAELDPKGLRRCLAGLLRLVPLLGVSDVLGAVRV